MSFVDGPSFEKEWNAMQPKKTKKLYIAAPFFSARQLNEVVKAEDAILKAGLEFYSPRSDGILQNMPPAQRLVAGPKLFQLNCKMLRNCDGVLALVDDADRGTDWECGYAFGLYQGLGKRVLGYKSDATKPLNIMVLQCFDAVAYGPSDLWAMLKAYEANASLHQWQARNVEQAP